MKQAFYNALKLLMSTRGFAHPLVLIAFYLSVPLLCLAQTDFTAPARDLAGKIAAVTGPGSVSLTTANRSSLSQSQLDSIVAALRSQLTGLGIRFVAADQAAVSAQVTFSENAQGYVWIAQVQQENNTPAVIMLPVQRIGPAAAMHASAALAIAKIQLWAQTAPILDVGVIDSPPKLIILEPERIVLYSRQNGSQFQQDQQFPISHVHPWPRDLRGRVVLRKDHLFDAYLPGVICATGSGGTLYVHCRESDDPWPLGSETSNLNAFFSPRRNFFTGVLAPALGKTSSLEAFYSAAAIPRGNYVLWLFAGLDGRITAADGMSELPVSAPGWGSDIASVKSSCGAGWQVLAASNSDGTKPDTIRAYQFPDRDPIPVTEAVEMGGTVVALWTEQTGNTAVAVSRDLQTGRYEAFRLAISCGQ